MKGFPDLPPLRWLGSIAAIYAIKWAVPSAHVEWSFLTALSWVVMVSALALIGWSGIWFMRKKTPIEPHHTPKVLIVEGPYRVSRNPIYLALVMLTLSSALGHGSVIGLAFVALLWWVLNQRFAIPEEVLLRETFGAQAQTYLERTKRWI
ncbi:MAG: isoprenylcysteine carboxylmethyltransferase family protein [Sulfitobacter sp.]